MLPAGRGLVHGLTWTRGDFVTGARESRILKSLLAKQICTEACWREER